MDAEVIGVSAAVLSCIGMLANSKYTADLNVVVLSQLDKDDRVSCFSQCTMFQVHVLLLKPKLVKAPSLSLMTVKQVWNNKFKKAS